VDCRTAPQELQIFSVQKQSFARVAPEKANTCILQRRNAFPSLAQSGPGLRPTGGTTGHGCSRTRWSRNLPRKCRWARPAQSGPARAAISDPLEVSERKFSTVSCSSRSIRSRERYTQAGFLGASHRYQPATACESMRSRLAADSAIEVLRTELSNRLEALLQRQFYPQ